MSESVAPALVLETENDIDPGTETPYQEASAAKIEVVEQGENKEEEDQNKEEEDQNNEMSEEEKKKEDEKWKNRERDFFAFLNPETEMSDDRPLVGRELVRELALHNKMRNQVVEQVKKLRDVPYIKNLMLSSSRDPTLEDLEGSELDIEGAFMPHPYPL